MNAAAPEAQDPGFDLADLLALRAVASRLDLGAHHLALSARAGGFRSPFRGRGLEFDELREYQPGDSLREVDWRVSARRGQLFTKRFREERERPVWLLADLGPSSFFGTQRCLKSRLVAECAALLAWAAVAAGDRLGGLVLSEQGQTLLPPLGRTRAALAYLHALLEAAPRAPSRLDKPYDHALNEALQRLDGLMRRSGRGALVVILSDFSALDGEAPALQQSLSRLSRHNDVLLCQLYDDFEAEPDSPLSQWPAALALSVAGSNRHWPLSSRRERQALANALRQRFERRQQQLQSLSRRLRLPLLSLKTSQQPAVALQQQWIKAGHAYGRARQG